MDNARQIAIETPVPDRAQTCSKAGGTPRNKVIRASSESGRRERIRTSGPYVPNVVLYQAELLSDGPGLSRFAAGRVLITAAPLCRNRDSSARNSPLLFLRQPGQVGRLSFPEDAVC